MHDFKTIYLAWVSSVPFVFSTIESGTAYTIILAIILPIIFFTIGKTVDVLLQMYFHNRRKHERKRLGRQLNRAPGRHSRHTP